MDLEKNKKYTRNTTFSTCHRHNIKRNYKYIDSNPTTLVNNQ